MMRTFHDQQWDRPASWYALAMRSRFEKKADLDLRSRGIESFLPLVEEVHMWSDRKKKVLEPLFRGYVFVKTDLRDKAQILQTDGVVRFVGVHQYPSPIPNEQINWIRILAHSPEAIRRENFVDVGDTVRVIAGPFLGVEGIVMKTKDSTRVVISLVSIAQSVSVEVEPEFLEKLGVPKEMLVSSM